MIPADLRRQLEELPWKWAPFWVQRDADGHFETVKVIRKADLDALLTEARVQEPPTNCRWSIDDFDGSYDTQCGEKFILNDGGPRENGNNILAASRPEAHNEP